MQVCYAVSTKLLIHLAKGVRFNFFFFLGGGCLLDFLNFDFLVAAYRFFFVSFFVFFFFAGEGGGESEVPLKFKSVNVPDIKQKHRSKRCIAEVRFQ